MVVKREKQERISISPKLCGNVYLLLKEIDKMKGVQLLKIEFEGSNHQQNKIRKSFGRIDAEISEKGVCIPRKVIKFNSNYNIISLIKNFEDLENFFLSHDPTYTLDAYPVSLTLLDKGILPNNALHLVELKKVRKLKQKSSIKQTLDTIKMPLDVIGIYKTRYHEKKDRYLKLESLREITEDCPFIEADDIKNYTRHLYDSSFTIKNRCVVGIEKRESIKYIHLEDGYCEEIQK